MEIHLQVLYIKIKAIYPCVQPPNTTQISQIYNGREHSSNTLEDWSWYCLVLSDKALTAQSGPLHCVCFVEIQVLTPFLTALYCTQTEARSSYYRPETMRKLLQVTLKTSNLYSANFASDPAGGDEATRVGQKRVNRARGTFCFRCLRKASPLFFCSAGLALKHTDSIKWKHKMPKLRNLPQPVHPAQDEYPVQI